MVIGLVPRSVFGLRASLRTVAHRDDDSIVYPAGHCTVVYNAKDKRQKFIQGNEGTDGITAVCVCSNKRFVAVAESKPSR